MQTQILALFETKPSFENFMPINNQHIVNLLTSYSQQFINIIGTKYSGKTHLLKAWCSQIGQTAIYLTDTDINVSSDDLITKYTHIAIDDIDNLNDLQQIQLFNLFNALKLQKLNNQVLTSSSCALEKIPHLRDEFRTRFLSGINLTLKAPNDEELKNALIFFLSKESITMGSNECNYLINHYTRNIGLLIQATRKIADIAVTQNRNITIPLIKEILSI
ncbi:MAG: DnaA/Hda family protein [Burkholderiales bacterium]|nr:DnaA/Hda family protein [Burkholderiales bacterium]